LKTKTTSWSIPADQIIDDHDPTLGKKQLMSCGRYISWMHSSEYRDQTDIRLKHLADIFFLDYKVVKFHYVCNKASQNVTKNDEDNFLSCYNSSHELCASNNAMSNEKNSELSVRKADYNDSSKWLKILLVETTTMRMFQITGSIISKHDTSLKDNSKYEHHRESTVKISASVQNHDKSMQTCNNEKQVSFINNLISGTCAKNDYRKCVVLLLFLLLTLSIVMGRDIKI